MKKYITDFCVVSNEELNSRLFLLKITPSDGSQIAECSAGQFVELRVDNAPEVLLRRPISIHRIDRDTNQMWLLIQKAGRGTNRMSVLHVGAQLNIVYPLGNGFEVKSASRTLLIGGGVGIAPLLETGHQIVANGGKVTFLLGGRTATDMVELDEYQKVGEVAITTEDGSLGTKGFVTNALGNGISLNDFDQVKVCGPAPMMKALYKQIQGMEGVADTLDVEFSLENKMACGLGVCLCCVEDTKDGHRCVCSDGPVFKMNDLKW